jgi:hypothetical protein
MTINVHPLFKQKCCKVTYRTKPSEEEKTFIRDCKREVEEGKRKKHPKEYVPFDVITEYILQYNALNALPNTGECLLSHNTHKQLPQRIQIVPDNLNKNSPIFYRTQN